jgi:excisionase family DNA binding protein
MPGKFSLASDSFINVKETAERLRCSEKTVRRMIDDGRLPAFQIGSLIRIRESDCGSLPATPREGRSRLKRKFLLDSLLRYESTSSVTDPFCGLLPVQLTPA